MELKYSDEGMSRQVWDDAMRWVEIISKKQSRRSYFSVQIIDVFKFSSFQVFKFSCLHVLMLSHSHVIMSSSYHVFMLLCFHVFTFSCFHFLQFSYPVSWRPLLSPYRTCRSTVCAPQRPPNKIVKKFK